MENQKLYRNPSQAVIAGVCSGIATYFKIDVTLVRILFVAGLLFTHGPLGLLYLILWVALPKNDENYVDYNTSLNLNNTNMKKSNGNLLGGAILVLMGFLFLAEEWGWWWFSFSKMWPLILILIGGYIMLKDKINPTDNNSDSSSTMP
jgi:phage shock protein C